MGNACSSHFCLWPNPPSGPQKSCQEGKTQPLGWEKADPFGESLMAARRLTPHPGNHRFETCCGSRSWQPCNTEHTVAKHCKTWICKLLRPADDRSSLSIPASATLVWDNTDGGFCYLPFPSWFATAVGLCKWYNSSSFPWHFLRRGNVLQLGLSLSLRGACGRSICGQASICSV